MTLERAALGVMLWGLAGAGFALVWLALPWPKASRTLKPTGCAACMAGWGTGIVAVGWHRDWYELALLAAILAALSPVRPSMLERMPVTIGRLSLIVAGGCALLGRALTWERRYDVGFVEVMCAWAAAWAVAAAVVATAWRESPVPADLDRDLPS